MTARFMSKKMIEKQDFYHPKKVEATIFRELQQIETL